MLENYSDSLKQIGIVVNEKSQGNATTHLRSVGFLKSLYCNLTVESSSKRFFLNRLSFDKVTAMSLLASLEHGAYHVSAVLRARVHG